MTASLGANSYGKSGIRLFKVERDGARHRVRDLTVAIAFEGEFTAAHIDGDNSLLFPTDTMKNTTYALAAGELGTPEEFGAVLAQHFLASSAAANKVRVSIAEHSWSRIELDGTPHNHAFMHGGGERRTAEVTLKRGDAHATITAGIDGMVILKSAQSAFTGYPRDRYTTLPETTDRILATSLTSSWSYVRTPLSFDDEFLKVRRALVESFANHDSKSVQHTLYAMGNAAHEASSNIDEIQLTMPNRHHLPVDLSPFGIENRDELFLPSAEPFGLIEAVVRRR
jgi:urate oxidase